MSGYWHGRRVADGKSRFNNNHDFTHNHLMFTNPPPPLNYSTFPYPPPCYPTPHSMSTTYRYQDPEGVSPPAGSELDFSDYPPPRPSSSSSQNSSVFLRSSISPQMSAPTAHGYSQCPFCPASFHSSSSSHLTTTHPHQMFYCRAYTSPGNACNQPFMSVSQLRIHLYNQHMITTFSSDKLVRTGAISLPRDLRMYKCKICPPDQKIFFGSSDPLSSHVASFHPELTESSSRKIFMFECRACEKYPLDDLAHLMKHIKMRHGRTREPSVEMIQVPLLQPSLSPNVIARSSPEDVEGEVVVEKVEPNMTRCTMCPSPGLVHKDQIITHQKSHNTALFSCAACKYKFEDYQDVEIHIRVRHKVTQDTGIKESIKLPIRELLLTMKCGVCNRQFVGQGEQVLKSHIESTHGKYYVGVGEGKNLLRVCRICGESCKDGVKMQRHLDCEHSPEVFAEDSNTEDDEVTNVKSKHSPPSIPTAVTSGRVAFMDIFKKEVAKRKAEYEKQEAETLRLRKVLRSTSESSASPVEEEFDIGELKVRKKKKREKKRKKSKKKRKRKVASDDDNETEASVPYKYKKLESKNIDQSRSLADGLSEDAADLLQMSSTKKLMEAKEVLRVSIEREESKCIFTSFEDDLKRMKEQLSETLRRSRELTDKVRKESEEDTRVTFHENELEISESSNKPSNNSSLQPQRPKFRMTWKK